MAKTNKNEIKNKLDSYEKVKVNIHISQQASNIITKIDDFDLDAFIDWYSKNRVIIAGGHVLEYLDKIGD